MSFRLSGRANAPLETAVDAIKSRLAHYDGVSAVRDSQGAGDPEIRLRLTPEAERLGLTRADVSRQLRQGFAGVIAAHVTVADGRIPVLIRYPEEDRATLRGVRLATPAGDRVPLEQLAKLSFAPGLAKIERLNGRRLVEITAHTEDQAEAGRIAAEMETTLLPELRRAAPDVAIAVGGLTEARRDFIVEWRHHMIVAGVLIYLVLAAGFQSFVQPLIVLIALPFGVAGAVWGHALLGLPLTAYSLLGLIALGGVVVNDNLVLLHRFNELRRAGRSAPIAIKEAALDRFRPIVLTSATTFVGLAPILLEASFQAQFVIPLATSLAFGVLAASAATLLLTPLILAFAGRPWPPRLRRLW